MNRLITQILACIVACTSWAQDGLDQRATDLAGLAQAKGNPGRGAVLFAAPTTACLSCHKVGEHGGNVGPELSEIGTKQTAEQLASSLISPKKVVAPEYQAIAVVTGDGEVIRGYRDRESNDELVIREVATGTHRVLDQNDIEAVQEVGTLMPDGLLAMLSDQDQADLLAFLIELGSHKTLRANAIGSLLAHANGHHPAEFDMPRRPLDPERWPSWQAHVNRDRVYDFYAKQARHFRDADPRPHLLAEYPGLDGGTYGHWGNQSEPTWASGAWNDTDLGSLISGVFHADQLHVSRGVCVRTGEGSKAVAACFDTDALAFRRYWVDGFIKFSSVRHGFMKGLTQDGSSIVFEGSAALPYDAKRSKKYLGLYRHGKQVLFAYRVGDREYIDTIKVEDGEFKHVVALRDEHPDRDLLHGGPPQWPQEFVTGGTPAHVARNSESTGGGPYVVDKIHLPTENPWNALLFCGGHDFLSDGSAVVCTMQGDVWRVSHLSDDLSNVTWRRIASGLHQALGVVVHQDQIYVLGRDQLTRLHDLNDDGEMDFYECYSQALETSRGGHDFTCGLLRDDQGRFYTASGKQGVMRIAADGQSAEVIAGGLRNSDGIGLTPDGLVTIPSSEGDWMPASMIAAVRPDGPVINRLITASSTENQIPFFGRPGTNRKYPPELPMLYLPRGVDNSSGGQVFVGGDKWGPVQNQMVHLSFGAGRAFLLLRDEFDGWIQGAAMPIAGELSSGAHRGKFSPIDGQLYVSGMSGWGTYTPDTGSFERIRYVPDQLPIPIGFHVHSNGIRVTFSEPLNRSLVEDARGHFAQCWNYRYSGAYGSPEFSARQLGLQGHDVLDIASATLLDDGKNLFIEIPELQKVNQLHLLVKSSAERSHDLFMTVHHLDEPLTTIPGYKPSEKVILPHPMLADFHRPKAVVRNPHRKALPGALPVHIRAARNLNFDKQTFTVPAGAPIRLTFHNPDAVPHNWALIQPGTLQQIGEQTNRMIADPEAASRHYIPDSEAVIAYTDVVNPNGKLTIYFEAPTRPGRYPYLCTFPGHWMVMNGTMVVQ
ncbi:MAG: c-type cytochrome [Pirellulaceae bacterium]|nr:c-type cytochrome [Pirellulaceae bacterium]